MLIPEVFRCITMFSHDFHLTSGFVEQDYEHRRVLVITLNFYHCVKTSSTNTRQFDRLQESTSLSQQRM